MSLLKVLLLGLVITVSAGNTIAGEKGGNTGDSEVALQILRDFSLSGSCFVPKSDKDAEELSKLCERLYSESDLSAYPYLDEFMENRLKFRNSCCNIE